MIKEAFRKTQKPASDLILQTMRELGKHYSRLELAYAKLERRNKELFDTCCFYSRKGFKARAVVYANEVVEIRKILSILQHTQLSVEQSILRLETFNAMSPTLDQLKGVFGDVKNALGLMANVMPSITPEIDKLNSAIGEVLDTTQFNLAPPEPLAIRDEGTEAILQEAANFVEQELRKKIPEPPFETRVPKPEKPMKPTKPMMALSADGSEVYLDENDSILENGDSSDVSQEIKSLSEELVMDYVERNDGEMNVTKCSKELNMPLAEVLKALESLNRKGKIKIESGL